MGLLPVLLIERRGKRTYVGPRSRKAECLRKRLHPDAIIN